MTRRSVLSKNNIGTTTYDQSLKSGDLQNMVFSETDLPSIFNSEAPKYDVIESDNLLTRKLNKSELKDVLEEKGLNTDGKVDQLRQRATEANIPLTETKGEVIPGYIRNPRGAQKIACERGFFLPAGLLPNGKKVSMNTKSSKHTITREIIVDKETSVISMLKECNDF